MQVAARISVLLIAPAPFVPLSVAVVIIRIAAVMSLHVRAMVAGVHLTVLITRLAPSIAVFAMVRITLPGAVRRVCWT
jgi:hypothetical protein